MSGFTEYVPPHTRVIRVKSVAEIDARSRCVDNSLVEDHDFCSLKRV
jgi:hypothetical protein